MLRSIPLFKDLSDSDLALLGNLAIEKPVPKGTVMFTEGQEGDSLYLIESGRVKVFIGDEDGREIILKILGPGDFFGEMALIDKQPRSASVSTLESSTFRILSHQAFEICIEKAPRIAAIVMQALAKRLRDADRKISTLALWMFTDGSPTRCWSWQSSITASSWSVKNSRSRILPIWSAHRAKW